MFTFIGEAREDEREEEQATKQDEREEEQATKEDEREEEQATSEIEEEQATSERGGGPIERILSRAQPNLSAALTTSAVLIHVNTFKQLLRGDCKMLIFKMTKLTFVGFGSCRRCRSGCHIFFFELSCWLCLALLLPPRFR